jgi:hypothetical protein
MLNALFKRTSPAMRALGCVCLSAVVSTASFCAETQAKMSLDDKEAIDVHNDLFWLTWIVWSLVIGLLIFAASIRFIAKRTTRPCHWCMEFISRKAAICPRCGKKIADAPRAISAPKPT